MSKLSDAKKLTLGADPEFCFARNNDLISAANLLSTNRNRGFDDEPGDDDFAINPDGEFGLDGCEDIAELRPKPSSDPYILVENIRAALNLGYTKVPGLKNYKWVATPYMDDYSMGGHIHLGFRDLPKGAFAHRLNNRSMTDLLDLYLGVPGILSEPSHEASYRRDNGDYGGLGDYRVQPWGMEYRVLSTWLSHPAVTLSILCLAKTVAVEGLMHGKDLKAVSANELNVLFNGMQDPPRNVLKEKLLPIIYTRLTKFELYPTYKEEIGFMLDMVYANKSTLAKKDMKATWNLSKLTPKVVKPTPKHLSQLFKSGRGLEAGVVQQGN